MKNNTRYSNSATVSVFRYLPLKESYNLFKIIIVNIRSASKIWQQSLKSRAHILRICIIQMYKEEFYVCPGKTTT